MISRITTLLTVLLITVAFPFSKAEALKLVTYAFEGDTRIGAVVGDTVIDLNRAYGALLDQQGDPRPRAMANAIVPADMVEFLQGEERSMARGRGSREAKLGQSAKGGNYDQQDYNIIDGAPAYRGASVFKG